MASTDSALHLMLIDGHSLVHRAYHALPPDMMTSAGELTNAVFGFTSIVLKEIQELRPSHIVMALDRPAPTFRHRQFAEYKATRPSTPPPLTSQFQRVREVAAALHIPIQELDGYEADDVLGTLALQAQQQHMHTTIVTGDLDALQLVSEDVEVLTPGRGISDTTLYDCEAVRRRYGLEPEQLPDWKALVGDKSDNIPGVPGIGPKAASELLAAHGSLEGIFAHLGDLPPRRRELLEPYAEQAMSSRMLARIVRDAPVSLTIEDAAFADVDRSRLMNLFAELEFRSLIDRIQSLMPASAPQPPPVMVDPAEAPLRQLSMFGADGGGGNGARSEGSTTATPVPLGAAPDTRTRVVHTRADLNDLMRDLREAGTFAVDTETTSTDPLRARLVGLSFAAHRDAAWYVPVGHAEGEQLPITEVLNALRPLLEDPAFAKAGHNLKYDYAVLARHGVGLRDLNFDTMIAAYLVNPQGRGLSLSALALGKLGVEMTPIESLIGKGKSQITMDLVDIPTVARYAGADAGVTLSLMEILRVDLQTRELTDLFVKVEMPLVPVLAEMEMVGIALDTQVLVEMSREMTAVIGDLEGRIYERACDRFNINSTAQLGKVLFQQLNLPSGRRTKTGFSTDSEVLENLRGKHPIVDEILEYRQLLKLKNTYIDTLPTLINPETGRIHTDFNQTVAATGRLSSSNPNLQNIPVRGELGRKIRRAFVPGHPGHVLLAADYSQIELRILASMSGDPRLVTAFTSGEDIHRATAAAVFNVSANEVTPDQRRIAKVVNFGIIYGIGELRLAYETGISRAEAGEFIANYNRTYAGVKSFMDSLRKEAVLYGYVSTMLHRRRYLPEINSNHPGVRAAAERAAINMPIQGTAADIIKLAMIRLHSELRERFPDAKMVLQVHDELVFDVPASDVQPVAALVRDAMEQAIELTVPLEVELKVGTNWYEMEPLAL
jgi:DNA polymerase-1